MNNKLINNLLNKRILGNFKPHVKRNLIDDIEIFIIRIDFVDPVSGEVESIISSVLAFPILEKKFDLEYYLNKYGSLEAIQSKIRNHILLDDEVIPEDQEITFYQQLGTN